MHDVGVQAFEILSQVEVHLRTQIVDEFAQSRLYSYYCNAAPCLFVGQIQGIGLKDGHFVPLLHKVLPYLSNGFVNPAAAGRFHRVG